MIRILIADDHTVVRKGLRQILAEEFTDAHIEDVADAEYELRQKGRDINDVGRVLAELKLGFWTRLFSRHYDALLWHNGTFITTAFPFANKQNRQRSNLATRFDQIRRFRNRVFHYEPILNNDLRKVHSDILETMGWIEPSLGQANSIIDRFNLVIEPYYFNQLKAKIAEKKKPI